MLDDARVLTLTPAQMTHRHVDAIFAAGWAEQDRHDTILTVCPFNVMDRFLEGHGVKGSADFCAARGQAPRDSGYSPLLALPPEGAVPVTAPP